MKRTKYSLKFLNNKKDRLIFLGIMFGILMMLSLFNNFIPNKEMTTDRSSYDDKNNDGYELNLENSAQLNNVCITEIYADSSDEWFELYNPNNEPVDLTNWELQDENYGVEWAFEDGLILQGHQVMTFGNTNADPAPNKTGSLQFGDSHDAAILYDNNGLIQDVVIYGDISLEPANNLLNSWAWNDGSGASAPSSPGESLERVNYTDDNNHPDDFEMDTTITPGKIPYSLLYNSNFTLQISEVMYGGNDEEWVEIRNNEYIELNLSSCILHSYRFGNRTTLPLDATINPLGTLIIGEHPSADISANLDLSDVGDVLVLKEPSESVIDVVVWGTGASNFTWGAENGWKTQDNATGGLSSGSSIFRYSWSRAMLADTNRSDDWYETSSPTPGSFYEIQIGDVLLSEIAPEEFPTSDEFIEIYNNKSFPVTLDGMEIWDYGTGAGLEIQFFGNISVPARDVIVASPNPIYDYQCDDAELSLTAEENLVLFRDSSKNYVLDVMLAEDDQTDYDWQAPSGGWNGPNNVSVTGIADGISIQRLNGSNHELKDTNSSADWTIASITPGYIPEYIAPPDYTRQIMISEVMYGGTENEWIELVNNGTTPVDLNNFKLYAYSDNNLTEIDLSAEIGAYETYVIGEPISVDVDLNKNLSLIDGGDVLELRNSDDEVIDVVVWGTGSSSFAYGLENGWIGSNNATGGLTEGNSIFRYNLTRVILSDSNKSSDWYTTSTPTPNGFYSLQPGDILITELYPHESNENEFIELYNNFTWPVTLDGMRINDFSQGDDEINFLGNITIPARSAFTAGENGSRYDYDTGTGLTLTTSREIVLYLGSLPIDVLIYGDSHDGTYPIGPSTGWNDVNNASTADWDTYESIQRLNGSNFELVDTNKSTDWEINDYTPGYIPEYVPPPPPPEAGNVSSVLITEVMVDPYDEITGEYIELFNTLDVAINIGNWSIWRSKYWDGSAEVLLPLGLSIPARSYFLIIDDATGSGYDFNCLNYSVSLSLTNSDARDIILADTNKTIIDRMAYRDSWSNGFVDTIDPVSWTDEGVYLGHEGYSLARIYDPQNNDEYIDTNSSSDWRYDVFRSIGQHTNVSYFLSRPITGDAQVIAFSSPDNSYNAIVNLFRKAKSTIDLSIYQFTSSYLMEELVSAMKRGVQVRLLLEDIYPGASVYSGGTDEAYEVVYIAQQIDNNENGTVKWEDKGWRYTHSKYFIVDNEVITISTENFKFTGIPKDSSAGNRGWGIAVNNTLLAQKYLNVFELDWSLGTLINETDMVSPRENDEVITGDYSPISSYQTEDITNAQFQTVVGPDETIDVIVDLIRRAKTTIDCEIFYMYPTWNNYPGGANNNPLMRAIIEAADRGVDVKVIFDSTYYVIEGDNNNDEAASILKAHGVQVRFSKNEGGIEKFHVKAMIVDDEAVMISSLNWNENSATNNREIGIIVNSTTVANYYVTLFNFDWEKQSSEDLPGEGGEEDGLPQTYTWLVWLPILAVAYIAILAVGYTIRYRGEKKEIKEQQARDAKRRAEEKNLMKQEEVELKQVPVDVDAIRNKMNTFYGDNVVVSHLDSQGIPKDTVIPSDFASEYIRINHELIEVGDLSRPIPEVILLKYDPNNYVVIEGKLELEFNIFDSSLKAKVRELSEEIQRLKTEEKTPLDELINNLQVTINKQKLKIMEYEQERKNQP